MLIVLAISSSVEAGTVLFNDRAAGVKWPTVYRINDLPCGTNGTDPVLICMKEVNQAQDRQRWLETREFVTHLGGQVSGWIKGSLQRPGVSWPQVLNPTNLQAVVFDPEIELKEPDLRIERGVGAAISADEMAYYLRLPPQLSKEQREEWVRKQEERGWGDPILSKFVEMNVQKFKIETSYLLNGECTTPAQKAEKSRLLAIHNTSQIRIQRLEKGEPGYDDALMASERLRMTIDPDATKRMEELRVKCERAAAEEKQSEKAVKLFNCLLEGRYTGRVSGRVGDVETPYGVTGGLGEGDMVGGLIEGKWTQVSDPSPESKEVFRSEGFALHGKLVGALKEYVTGADGVTRISAESDYRNGVKVGKSTIYQNGKPSLVEIRNDAGEMIQKRTYCSDGVKVALEELYKTGSSSPVATKSFDCP